MADDLWQPGPRMAALVRTASSLAPGSQDWSAFLSPELFPQYFLRGEGPRLVDVDERSYLDVYGGAGSVILGHGASEQVRAVAVQLNHGAQVSFRHPVERELAAWLSSRIPFARRVLFFKTGSEACQAAVRAALQNGERRALISVGYHGWLPPYEDGWPRTELTVIRCGWDLAQIQAAAAQHGAGIGAIVVSPRAATMDPAFYRGCQEVARDTGAAFVMDEVQTGFRAAFPCWSVACGLTPDLVILSKAIANGFPLAVLAGSESLLGDAEALSVFSTFAAETIGMVAARSCLLALEGGMYQRFERAATSIHLALEQMFSGQRPIRVVGGPTFFRLAIEDREQALLFVRRLAHRGVLLHPSDNFILSAAFDDPDVQGALLAALADAARASGLM
jgi:glutamate-1-semialdehyde 2,1-aminomutase